MMLETERLILREFIDGDAEALHAVESEPEVARYQSFEPRTLDESRAYVQRAREGAAAAPRYVYDLAVVLRADGRLVGRCGLGMSDPERRQAMLWYTVHRACWGQGYATEAAQALVGFAFTDLGLHRVWADCDPANVGSYRVLEKLGMRREAHLRENAWLKGAWVDTLIYALLDREWVAQPGPEADAR